MSEDLETRLRDAEASNAHLREQLFSLHAQRVQMQGYLFKFKSYPVGLFNDAWELRYFSLVDACLKCYLSEQTTSLVPETELLVQGYSLYWEGIKKKKYWTFAFKDHNGCVVLRLSSADRPTAWKWMAALEQAVAGGVKSTGGSSLVRMQSMPLTPTSLSESDEGGTPHVREYPDFVAPEEDAAPRSRSKMAGSTPVHTKTRASVLSSERLLQHPHPGILNLGMVILVAANFRLVLENVFKYGFRANPLRWFERLLWGSSQPLMLCWPVLAASLCCAYCVELLAWRFVQRQEARRKKLDVKEAKLRGEGLVAALHVMNVASCFALAFWLVYLSQDAVVPSFVLTLLTLIVCMKLISYAHCNADLRRSCLARSDAEAADAEQQISYPENLTVGNLAYFAFAPTLTYQIAFPRSTRIRGKWLLRRCSELIVALSLQLTIIDQYIAPAVENSMVPLENREFIALVERVLKLSLPVLYAWLIMFYIFFHLWLNILAEAMRFGDREFYLDWWNARNLGDYWKVWNIPVHRWMLRTIYYPAIHYGRFIVNEVI